MGGKDLLSQFAIILELKMVLVWLCHVTSASQLSERDHLLVDWSDELVITVSLHDCAKATDRHGL